MSAYALTNDYAAGAAHFVRRGSLQSQDVLRRSKTFFLQQLSAKWSSLAQALKYLWTMSRTLFDLDDTPEAKTEERTLPRPRRAAIVPVRLTEGPSEKLADFQRSQDSAVSELREALHGLTRQTDVLPAWRAWWARRTAAWGLVLVVLFGVGVGLAWRAHTLAQSTHDVLEQILENQTKAQAAKAGKR